MKNRKVSKLLGVRGIGNQKILIDNGDGTTQKVKLKDVDHINVCHNEALQVDSPWIATCRNSVIIGNVGSSHFIVQRRQDYMATAQFAEQYHTTKDMFNNIR